MSKLGEILKELFPLREMGNQILGHQRTDSIVKFGQDIASHAKSLGTSAFRGIRTGFDNTKPNLRPQTIKQLFQLATGGPEAVLPGLIKQHLPNQAADNGRVKGIGEYFRNLGAAAGNYAGSIGSKIGRGFGAIGGMFGGGGSEKEKREEQAAHSMGGLKKAGDSLLVMFLKLAGLKYILDSLGSVFRKYTGELSESNRDLARWNGSIAASFNRLDIARMRLDIQQGRGTSGTTSELNTQLGMMLKEFQPIREGLGNLTNIIGINLIKIARVGIEQLKALQDMFPALKDVVKGLEDMNEEMKKGKPDIAAGNQALDDLVRMPGGGNRQRQLPAGIAPPLPPNFFLHRPPVGHGRHGHSGLRP